jgi:inorganic pyrophosphatase
MSFNHVPAGKDLPQDFNVIIEIPAQSDPVKYEADKDLGLLVVDRFISTGMRYPANYGFIPQTLSGDGDPVDVLVITPFPLLDGNPEVDRRRAVVPERPDQALLRAIQGAGERQVGEGRRLGGRRSRSQGNH